MTHVFDRYHSKHGRYPRVVTRNGVQTLTLEFHPGYVHIQASGPFGGEIYITSQAIRVLLKQHRRRILSLILHQDRSVDVPRRVHAYYLEEISHSQALKAEKRARKKTLTQKARYEAARQRAASY